jgi:hypothetical protein
MGQIEDVEYAKYAPGSFTTPERDLLPKVRMAREKEKDLETVECGENK